MPHRLQVERVGIEIEAHGDAWTRGGNGSNEGPGLAADVGELPTGVDRAPADRQGGDVTVRAWVPIRGGTAGRIQRGDLAAKLSADKSELPPGVDQAPAHCQAVDMAIRVRDPAGGGTGCRIERGEVVARLSADAGEATARVDGAPAHCQGGDRVLVAEAPARARVPGCRGTAGHELRSTSTIGRMVAAQTRHTPKGATC